MKIDLHLHNKKIVDGDPETRNIDHENFKKKLIEADVRLAAITNHNYFDSDVYDSYKSEKEYLLLPGMEVDVQAKNKRFQVNIILSPNDSEKLKKIWKKEFKDKVSSIAPISIKNFISIFKEYQIILLLDYKSNNGTKCSLDDYEHLKKELGNSAVIIFDVNNYQTHFVLAAHSYDSIICSDVRDWEEYLKISEKLLSSNIKIESFDRFYKILKKDPKVLREITSNYEKINYKIEIDDSKFNIEMHNGLTIVIGDKATGKTRFLKNIKENLDKKDIKYQSLFEKEEDKKYEELIKPIVTEEAKKYEQKIKSKIDELFASIEIPVHSPNSYKKYFEYLKSKNKNYIKIQNMNIGNKKKVDLNELKNIIDITKEYENEMMKNYNQQEWLKDNSAKNKMIEKIKVFRKDIIMNIWLSYISFYKKELGHIILEKIVSSIKNVVGENKGIQSKITNIGLFKRWDYLNKINKLKNEILKFEHNENQKIDTFEIPGEGTIKLIQEENNFKLDQEIVKDKKVDYTVKDWRDNVVSFFKLDWINFKNIEKFDKFWKENNKKSLISTKRILKKDDNKVFNPSSGQVSIIILLDILRAKEGCDYIILDEPAMKLGSNSIMGTFNKRITALKRMEKTILISTHNGNIGVNAIPKTYIYREKENGKYKTYKGYVVSNALINIDNSEDKKEISNVILQTLEGGRNPFIFRKDIYDIKD